MHPVQVQYGFVVLWHVCLFRLHVYSVQAPATHVAAADMLISPVQYDHRASRPRHREALANAVTKARTLIGEEDPLSTPLRLKDQRPQALVEEASVTWPQEPTLRAPVASIPRDAVEVLRRKNAEIMRRVEEARRTWAKDRMGAPADT